MRRFVTASLWKKPGRGCFCEGDSLSSSVEHEMNTDGVRAAGVRHWNSKGSQAAFVNRWPCGAQASGIGTAEKAGM